MGERLLDSIIEDLFVTVHRQHLDSSELFETAKRVFALATRLDWTDEVATDIEDLQRHLPAGWEQRLWAASARARRYVRAGDRKSAAAALREVVREIAVGARWRPLTFFGYDDLLDPDLLAAHVLDKNRLVARYPQLDGNRIDEAHGWALRLHGRLARVRPEHGAQIVLPG